MKQKVDQQEKEIKELRDETEEIKRRIAELWCIHMRGTKNERRIIENNNCPFIIQ